VICLESHQYHQHTPTHNDIFPHLLLALPRALSRVCWHWCDGSRRADSFSLSRAFFQIDVKTTFKKLAAETMRIQAKTEDCRCVSPVHFFRPSLLLFSILYVPRSSCSGQT